MIIKERKLKGAFEIQLEPKEDHRGFFMSSYDDKILEQYGINKKWVQENHSFSKEKGTIRGIHLQLQPGTSAKLRRVVQGEIFDVFVDLRKDSETFGQWDSIVLSAENKKMIYIPRGFAYGMCSLTNDAAMVYRVDNYYAPELERQIKWNDPDLKINWPLEKEPIVSEKDTTAKSFKEFCEQYGGIEIN